MTISQPLTTKPATTTPISTSTPTPTPTSTPTSTRTSTPTAVSVPTRKQTLIHKIFHSHHHHHSPPASSDHEEDPYLLAAGAGSSPLEKKHMFNFGHVLGHRVGGGGSSTFGSDRGHGTGSYSGAGSGIGVGAAAATGRGDHAHGSIRASGERCSLLEKYGICDKGNIGQGATAVVRLAHKLILPHEDNTNTHTNGATRSEKLFAVKEFRKRRKDETEKEYVKKLTSEFCISSTLHHENVVETVDLVQDESHHWCEVMEYCCGGDLYNAIKQGRMSRIEIDCCFKQLLNGVAYLHLMGVAHRDIKPENLLLDGQGRLKITDFGVSDVFRMCWEKTPHLSRGLCGSEPYIAPEEFKSKEYDARRVDIWACGIVYYCMVYKGIPFRAATSQDPNYQHFVEMRAVNNYEPFEKLPVGCRKLIKRILDPDPKTRITIEEIMEDEWFKSIETCVHGENQNPHRHFEYQSA
ncbi:serine/threonine-protein kinase HAL4/sat4 [Mortierella claussenii]|nr:serine/threonine-protein kinase HAL4/sat4 [Mortierella claussenii]